MLLEKSQEKKRAPVAMPEQWGLAEEKRRDHIVDVAIGIEPAELLESSYWSHLAPNFGTLDKIEARSEDGSWIMNLRVVYAERNYAQVVQEGPVFQIGQNAETVNPGAKHSVSWKGGVLGFVVIRASDQEIVKAKCKTREEATAWMIEHEKTTRV